jgi:hypothetical protein
VNSRVIAWEFVADGHSCHEALGHHSQGMMRPPVMNRR